MAELKRKRERGLASIARARADRGNGRERWSTQAGLVALAAVVGGFVAHHFVTAHELKSDQQALLAKQRAVAATLGEQWFPLRDSLENDVLGAAKDYAGDKIDDAARAAKFRTQPGLYLRMRVADARDTASIRRGAADSRKDAFAGCFLREANERGVRGEIDGGAFAEQPWNLGRAYTATRILTDDWVNDVKDADDDLRLRVFVQQFDQAVKTEVPLAIDVVKHATFFLLVLDEDTPEAARVAEGGIIDEPALQLVPHEARVHLFELPSGSEILRLKRSGSGQIISAGENIVTDSETRDAMQRQTNNCMLARRVEEAIKASR